MSDPAPRPVRPGDRLRFAAGVAVLAATALCLYRPWVDRPFDILDFSEFLPLLTGNGSFWTRFAALTGYYFHDHGRLNLAGYVALAAKWTFLGASPVLWQWARVAEMGVVVAAIYLLFRRLALRPFPALAGASLYVIGRIVVEGWMRMTMGEPLGLLAALGALHLATTWRERPRSLRRAALAGLLMAIAVLAKEMLIGMLPLVWMVGTLRESDGRFGRAELGEDGWPRLLWSGGPPILAFALAGIAALNARSAGFTALYGQASPTFGSFLALLARPWLPQGSVHGTEAFTFPGNAAFLVVTLGGAWLAMRQEGCRRHARGILAAAIGTSLAFAALYLPWPAITFYYVIPFHLAVAMLFAAALQAIADNEHAGRGIALGGYAVIALWTVPSSARAASEIIALQQVNGELVARLGTVHGADRIVVAGEGVVAQAWMGTGPTLRRYALATGAARDLPPATDLPCAAVDTLLRRTPGHIIVIDYLPGCRGLPPATVTVSRPFRFVWTWWSGAGVGTDSVAAQVRFDPTTPPSR